MKSLKLDNQIPYSKYNLDTFANHRATSCNHNNNYDDQDINNSNNMIKIDENKIEKNSNQFNSSSSSKPLKSNTKTTTTTQTTASPPIIKKRNKLNNLSYSPSSSSASTTTSNGGGSGLSDNDSDALSDTDSEEEKQISSHLFADSNKLIQLKKFTLLNESPPIKQTKHKDPSLFTSIVEKWETINSNINQIGNDHPSPPIINSISNPNIPILPTTPKSNSQSTTTTINTNSTSTNNRNTKSLLTTSSSTSITTNRFILLLFRILVFPFLFVASIPFIICICSFIIFLAVFSFGTISVFIFLLGIAPFFVIGIMSIFYLVCFLVTGSVSNVHRPMINLLVNIYESIMKGITFVIAFALLKLKILFDKNNNSVSNSNDKQRHYYQRSI